MGFCEEWGRGVGQFVINNLQVEVFQVMWFWLPKYKGFLNNEDTGCRKINVFQVGGLVGKNLRNLEKNKIKNIEGYLQRYMGLKVQTFHHVFFK
jgi:hypothetical protein